MRKLTQAIVLFVLMLSVNACLEVKFRESQPAGVEPLSEIPSHLQGKYRNQDGDTLILTSTTFTLLNRKSECSKMKEYDSLSEKILIKQWNDFLFLNINEDSLWTVALIQKKEDGSFVFSLIDGEEEETVQLISDITFLTTHYSEDDEPLVYVVNPSKTKLEQMISKDVFSINYHFQRLP
jgi:hypothetical protein